MFVVFMMNKYASNTAYFNVIFIWLTGRIQKVCSPDSHKLLGWRSIVSAKQHSNTCLGRCMSWSVSFADFAFFSQLILSLAVAIVWWSPAKNDHFSAHVSSGPSLTHCPIWLWADECNRQENLKQLDGMLTRWALFHIQDSHCTICYSLLGHGWCSSETSFKETDLMLHSGGPLLCTGETFGQTLQASGDFAYALSNFPNQQTSQPQML